MYTFYPQDNVPIKFWKPKKNKKSTIIILPFPNKPFGEEKLNEFTCSICQQKLKKENK